MNWVDITILVLLGIGGLLGLKSGLLWQIARFVIFGVSVYVTIYYHGPMGDFLSQQLAGTDPSVLKGLSYFFTFLTSYILLYVLTMLIERGIRAMKLKWLDRVLGAGVGMLQAALICAVLLLGVTLVPSKAIQPDIEASHLAPPIILGTRALALAVPEEQREKVSNWLDEMRTGAEKKVEETVKEKVKETVNEKIKETVNEKPKTTEKDEVEEAVRRALESPSR